MESSIAGSGFNDKRKSTRRKVSYVQGKDGDNTSVAVYSIEVPEEVEYGDVSLDVIENADMKTYAYFKRWHDLMKNADGTFNPRQKYVKSAYIQLLNTDDMILRQFTVEEAWVKEIDALDLDYKNNDFLVFGVVLSCVRIS
jgi:hypothetical protein